MNAESVKARTIVTSKSTAIAHKTSWSFLVPAVGGALLAVGFHFAAVTLGAETGVRFLAALAGVSGWLYLAMGFQSQRPAGLVAGAAAAVALFAVALLAVHHSPASVGALFLIQAGIGLVAVTLHERTHPLVAWISLNAVLGILTVI